MLSTWRLGMTEYDAFVAVIFTGLCAVIYAVVWCLSSCLLLDGVALEWLNVSS